MGHPLTIDYPNVSNISRWLAGIITSRYWIVNSLSMTINNLKLVPLLFLILPLSTKALSFCFLPLHQIKDFAFEGVLTRLVPWPVHTHHISPLHTSTLAGLDALKSHDWLSPGLHNGWHMISCCGPSVPVCTVKPSWLFAYTQGR